VHFVYHKGDLMSTIQRLRAPLIGVLGVIMAVVAFAGPATAAPYTTQPTTSVSNQTPAAGSALTFCGAGFQAGETVTIAVINGTKYPSVVADASGAFCTTIVLGVSLTGTQTLVATGTTSGRTSSTQIQIATAAASAGAAGTTPSGGLAFTGATVIGIGALGGLLLIGGATMVLASRRRRVTA
jgi:hypothetical protein